ncbi:MAG TPA: CoA transferase, partial [Acidimicrobiia bacterium]
VFKTEGVEFWVDLLEQAGVPVGRVLTIAEAFDDPQARRHGMLVEFDHPTAGNVRTTGSPLRLDGDQAISPTLPPVLGQDTRALLKEMGVDSATIETMIEEGRAISP